MNCIQCGEAHDKKGTYCSKRCADKAYRDRKSGKPDAIPLLRDRSFKKESIDVPAEVGPKNKWCNFCGKSLEQSTMLQFCDIEHQEEYWKTVNREGALKLQIDSRTVIETKKYKRVQELIEAIMGRNGILSFFN
jgi:predicted nucleic acid-binding Zn ribbon protein